MTPSPSLPPIDPNLMPFPNRNPEPANDVHFSRDPTAEGDDRSSSLSEIGDRVGNEDISSAKLAPIDGSEANDTEAETERLEDSPQRTRKRKNLVMTSLNHVLSNGASPVANHVLPINEGKPDFAVGKIDLLSEISSLADSGEENAKLLPSSSPSSRKRKRPSSEGGSQSGTEFNNKPLLKYPEMTEGEHLHHPAAVGQEDNLDQYTIGEDQVPSDVGATFPADDNEPPNASQFLTVKQQNRKGKRKGKKVRDENSGALGSIVSGVGIQSELNGTIEGEYSNGEDAEMEEGGEDGEVDANARNEEGLLKKKSAMDSLTAIEKCFAALRDKLFTEKLAQYNEELAMLDQTNPTHPDFINLKRVIDKHRDDKIDYEQNLLRYKLVALQRKSTAEKAQIHTQYMQTVRDIRERTLEQLQKESYQLQRERRKIEGDVSDYSYHFPTRRSQQIANQTAYNTEVSILSGIAKHVGFPSAPEISGAKPSEIEEDFLAMGISTQPAPGLPTGAPARGNILSAGATVGRRKPAAEEDYMERNPWANAQHPAHHHNLHLTRQASVIYRPDSRISTPVSQRRNVDHNVPHGSASTIVEAHSGPNSSAAQTPATREQVAGVTEPSRDSTSGNLMSITPIKLVTTLDEASTASLGTQEKMAIDKVKNPQFAVRVQSLPSSASINLLQRNNVATDTALSSPKVTDSSDKSTGPIALPSNTIRYPVVKVEETLHPSRQAPTIQYHHPPVPANSPLNGQVDRIGA